MKRSVLVLVFVLALAVSALPAAASSQPELAPLHDATGEVIEGQYIVVLEEGALGAQVASSLGVETLHVYEHALGGFAAELTATELEAVRRHPAVAFVEQDQVASVVDTRPTRDRPAEPDAGSGDVGTMNQWNPPSWGLDRIDQRFLPLDNWYFYNQTASIVDIYIVDTGVQWDHPHLQKVMAGYDAFGGNSYDCHGHGTHVAGTAASPTYGVAKDAWTWSVRVLDCSGFGSYAGIIAGTDWVRQNIGQWPGYPPIANYSLGGGYSGALNQAIDNLSNAGVTVAVAAGNSNADACNYSPASASTAVSVAASDRNDWRAWFSNYGPCVHLYAPGVDITAPWLGGGVTTISGTSMAAPHVAGVAAMYKATHGNHHWSTVRNWLINVSTHGVINGNPAGTPNRLLYTNNL